MNAADEISQAERQRIMADERRLRTYQGHALDGEPDLGGRFAKVHTTTVTGSSPVSAIPQQPAGSPWAKDECPPEPPLGFSVEEMEPVGEAFEIEASTVAASAVEGEGPAAAALSHVVNVAAGSNKFKRRF